MYKPHTVCRACGLGSVAPGIKAAPSNHLIPVFNLGIQPLANDFCGDGEQRSGYAPLEVLICPRCKLAQLSATVRPDILYSKYAYVTSTSKTMEAHFDNLIAELSARCPAKTIVEIGSNDGLFLEHWLKKGAERVLGIDPAENLTRIARDKGINCLTGVFDSELSRMATVSMPQVDLIIARHVFCHVDDWQAFIHALLFMCARDTLVYIEVPYVQWLLDKTEFDTIYHEHTSYLNIESIQHLLDHSGLRLHEILSFTIHGGALGLLLRRQDSEEKIDRSVAAFVHKENCGQADWEQFSVRARDQIFGLNNLVKDLVDGGKRVCGYGASAKSTVWINACHFTKREIYGVYDNSKTKWYKFVPGTDIPVINEGAFYVDNPDYAVNFSWNFRAEIEAKQKKWSDGGGKWIVPVPSVQII
jgi:novobiocin biosynthesis protein NovU/D-mycarose 3-C-methyltransferase